MRDMVYQGTTWGCCLWNLFFADAHHVVTDAGFTDTTYADDLNAFKTYPSVTPTATIHNDLNTVQTNLHTWGNNRQITFDAGKESTHIHSRTNPEATYFQNISRIWWQIWLS